MSPDVLAVMDRYAAAFRPNAGLDGADLAEARGAVLELIAIATEAAKQLAAMGATAHASNLSSAIARATGAQP